ncbi:MAG: hypothetical protein GXY38_10395 [Planctomycetes bacterium]|nr:hypothetical protein [Planctomycetota bacterium]
MNIATIIGPTSRRFGVFLAAGLVLLSAAGLRAAIPADPSARTMKELNEKEAAFTLRMYLDAYYQCGDKHPAWNEKVRAFLEVMARHDTNDINEPLLSELKEMVRELYLLGCEDPIVTTLWIRVFDPSGRLPFPRQMKHNLYGQLVDRGYPAYIRMQAARRLYLDQPRLNKSTHYLDSMIDALHEFLEQDVFGPDERDVQIVKFIDLVKYLPGEYGQKALLALKASPNVDEVVYETVAGEYYHWLAWEARGPGGISYVSDEGWSQYSKLREQARQHLTKAWELDPALPYAADSMVSICYGQPEARIWFERCVGACFDYLPAYRNYLSGIQPGWGGSKEKMYAFGLECMQTGRYDTLAPYQLIATLVDISTTDMGGADYFFWRQPGVYENARRVLETYAAGPDFQDQQAFYLTMLLGFAMRTDHWQDARAAFDKLEGKYDPAAMKRVGLKAEEIAGPVLAFSGPDGGSKWQGVVLKNRRNYRQAEAIFRHALAQAKPGPVARYLKDVLQRTRWQRDYHNGDWVRLDADADLAGWRVRKGVWTSDEDGSLIGLSHSDPAIIWCNLDVGEHVEVKATFTFEDSPGGDAVCGIALGEFSISEWKSLWSSVEIRQADEKVGMGFQGCDHESVRRGQFQARNTLHISKRGRRVKVWLNDSIVYGDDEIANYEPTRVVNIGIVCGWSDSSWKIRASDIQIRKLDLTAGTAKSTDW